MMLVHKSTSSLAEFSVKKTTITSLEGPFDQTDQAKTVETNVTYANKEQNRNST